MTFEQWWAEKGDSYSAAKYMARLAWNAALELAECEALAVGEDAHEAAKEKDATDYVAGYQDAAVDAQEAIKALRAIIP